MLSPIQVIQGTGGRLVQVVGTTTTTRSSTTAQIPVDDTVPQNSEGAEAFTLAITPKSTSNQLYIFAWLSGAVNTNSDAVTIALFRDTGVGALATAYSVIGGAQIVVPIVLNFTHSAPVTISTTYKIRYGSSASTAYLNRDTSLRFNGTVHSGMFIVEVIP